MKYDKPELALLAPAVHAIQARGRKAVPDSFPELATNAAYEAHEKMNRSWGTRTKECPA